MKRLLLFLILLIILPSAVFAAVSDGTKETDELLSVLPSDIAKEVEKAAEDGMYELRGGLKSILTGIKSKAVNLMLDGVANAAKLFAISAVCGLIGGALSNTNATNSNVLNIVGAGCVLAVGAAQTGSVFSDCAELISELNVFSKAFIVSMSAATIASGYPVSATSKQAAALFGADILITVFSKILLPCVCIYLGLRFLQIVTENQMFARISGFIKTAIINMLKYLLIIYFAYISISGIIGASTDTLAKKAAKTAVSTVIPVVGGIISDGTDAVFAAAAVLKSTIGAFGVIASVAISALPLVNMGCNYLSVRIAAAISFGLDGGGASQAIDALGDALSLAFALCAAATSLVIITAVVFMKTTGY